MPVLIDDILNNIKLDFNNDLNVILHNDETLYALHVVESLKKHVKLNYNKAYAIMIDANNNNKAFVIACPRIDAERYQTLLESDGLTITLE